MVVNINEWLCKRNNFFYYLFWYGRVEVVILNWIKTQSFFQYYWTICNVARVLTQIDINFLEYFLINLFQKFFANFPKFVVSWINQATWWFVVKVTSIKYRNVNSNFQEKLKSGISKICCKSYLCGLLKVMKVSVLARWSILSGNICIWLCDVF